MGRRRAQYAIGIAVWLCIVAAGLFVRSASPSLITIVDVALLVALIMLVDGGGSIYKLALWFRYRKDSDKRELIASSGQMYPEKLRKFLMDEPDEHETETSHEASFVSEKED
jgi:hypothetical protein